MPIDEKRARALVLDGDQESALAVVRSLGRKGLDVHVGSSTRRPIASLSRHCTRSLLYPDPVIDIPGFRAALQEWVGGGSYSLIIPVTDLTLCPLMDFRHELEKSCPVAMAANESIALAHSKSRTYELAVSFGIPTPRSATVRNRNDLPVAGQAFSYPVVIKPDRSRVWPEGGGPGLHLSTSYAFLPEAVEAETGRLLAYGPVVLQERIPGESVGLGVIASAGRLLGAFQFRSLHEVPLSGGISSYRVSEPIDPELLGHASALLEALAWDGVAHVEFIRDRATGKATLMEINGRFWASLPLATAAGMDFPAHLYDLMVLKHSSFPAQYRTGLGCHLLNREIDWGKEVFRRILRSEKDDLVLLPDFKSAVVDVLRLFNPFLRTDAMDFRDPLPGFHDRANFFRKTFTEATRLLKRRTSE